MGRRRIDGKQCLSASVRRPWRADWYSLRRGSSLSRGNGDIPRCVVLDSARPKCGTNRSERSADVIVSAVDRYEILRQLQLSLALVRRGRKW
jgi:hypothetical protein